ncbi:MAG: hypothetical protein ACJ75F_05005 [Flavisolibacter sp.]|jgi:hypothetical protein
MKKLIIILYSVLFSLNAMAHTPGEIDRKLLQSFDSSFPHATEVAWQDIGEAYEVYFIQNGVRSKIIYSKDLTVVQLTRYYKEEQLPYAIDYLLGRDFPKQKVFGVTETSTISLPDNRVSVEYQVVLEDAGRWYQVKMNQDGSFTLIRKLRKA